MGGGWLSVAGLKVDLLYRCVEVVSAVIADCRAGAIAMDYQPGHSHGFCSTIWLGEVALCRPLHDPRGAIAVLKALSSPYPDKLREALIGTFVWEGSFSVDNGETAVARGDQTHIAGCAYRALCCVSQVLFALKRRFLINEKGALAEATSFPHTVAGLSHRADRVWATIGRTQLGSALAELRTLDRDVRALVKRRSSPRIFPLSIPEEIPIISPRGFRFPKETRARSPIPRKGDRHDSVMSLMS